MYLERIPSCGLCRMNGVRGSIDCALELSAPFCPPTEVVSDRRKDRNTQPSEIVWRHAMPFKRFAKLLKVEHLRWACWTLASIAVVDAFDPCTLKDDDGMIVLLCRHRSERRKDSGLYRSTDDFLGDDDDDRKAIECRALCRRFRNGRAEDALEAVVEFQ